MMDALVRFLVWLSGRGMPAYREPRAIVVCLESERLRRRLNEMFDGKKGA